MAKPDGLGRSSQHRNARGSLTTLGERPVPPAQAFGADVLQQASTLRSHLVLDVASSTAGSAAGSAA